MNVYLIIADDHALRESVKATMPPGDVLFFESTQEGALRRLVTIDPDVVLIDDAPNLGTDTILEVLRARPDASVLALTAHSDAQTLAELALAGAKASVPKPFSCDEILSKINELQRFPGLSTAAPPLRSTGEVSSASPAALTNTQYRTAMRWLTRVATGRRSESQIAHSLCEVVDDLFAPSRCAVLLEGAGRARLAASLGMAPALVEDVQLGMHTGLMAWLQRHRRMVNPNDLQDDSIALKEIRVLGAQLAAPITAGAEVIGAILLGASTSDQFFAPESRELITILSKGASTALEHIRRFGTLSDHQQELERFVSAVPSGMIQVAEDKTIMLVNARAEDLLQLNAKDLLGQSVQRLGSSFADVVLRARNENKPLLRQEIRDAATRRTLGLSATPMPGGGVGVVFNELPKQRSTAKDVAYSPFWDYLAGRVAQEIKNPLVAISAFAQLLPRKYDEPEFRTEFSAVVQREVKRIDGVAEALFEFSRELRLHKIEADVNDTIERVLRAYSEELEARAIVLETNLDKAHGTAAFDAAQLSKALEHVVQNAVEAMPEGGVLRIESGQRNGHLRIRVRDTGPGVAEPIRPLIFLPFFSTKERGMGLGLTMASRIMDGHHGELRLVEMSEGGGVFEFDLPKTGDDHADDTGG